MPCVTLQPQTGILLHNNKEHPDMCLIIHNPRFVYINHGPLMGLKQPPATQHTPSKKIKYSQGGTYLMEKHTFIMQHALKHAAHPASSDPTAT